MKIFTNTLLILLVFVTCAKAQTSECDLSTYSVVSTPDTKVAVASVTANTQSGTAENAAKSIDNDLATFYHSAYSFVVSASNPAVLTYNFTGNPTLDYIVYHPRQSGVNGHFGELEVQYRLTGQSAYSTLMNFDAGYSQSPSVINFPTRLVGVTNIRISVKNGSNNNAACAEMMFYTKTTPDIKIAPSSAAANVAQGAETLDKTIDNDLSTLYHSPYSGYVVSASNPAVLTYDFTGSPTLDYLVYQPRTVGTNGNFGEIEILYKLDGQSTYTSWFSYNAELSNLASVINFPSSLANVASIQLRVKSGVGNFASCAEMAFYQLAVPDASVTGGVFADNLFTALKPGTTQAQVDAISSPYYKALANCMLNNTYNFKYRVQEYQPYNIVAKLAERLKTSTYNVYENPTGMFFQSGKQVVIFVGPQASNFPISLSVADLRVFSSTGDTNYPKTTYPLKAGLNTITVAADGLGYINYYTDNATAAPVKVHITGGIVNGCFDYSKDTDAEWQSIVNNTTYAQVDIKGLYMNLLFEKSRIKTYHPTSVKPLVEIYDKIVKIQYDMMGFDKYNIRPKNHMFAYAHNTGGLFAGSIGMHFDYSWGTGFYVSANQVINGDMWGVAHEIGHINQVRPGLKWTGMTEVTNNIFSAYSQFTIGPTAGINARLERESANPAAAPTDEGNGSNLVVGGRYKGFFDRAIINNENHINQNYFGRAVPFWQLQLYYQFAGALKGAPTLEQRRNGTPAPASGPDYAHFMGDVMQLIRNRNEAGLSEETLMLNFVKDICDVTQEDLTDFFIKVGMLKAIDVTISDYGTKPYKITQAAIDAAIASVKAKGYPAPVSPVLHYLSANSLNAFKNKLIATGTYKVGTTLSGSNANRILTVSHNSWKNVVAFESYKTDNTTLLEVTVVGMRSTGNTQTVIRYPVSANTADDPDWVYAVSYDGTKTLVYSRTSISVLPVKLTSFEANLTNNDVLLKWKTSAEKNNKHFEILKSTDGTNFNKIAEVAGAGTKETPSVYQYVDKNFQQFAYYKLSQVDFDGTTKVFEDDIKYVKVLGETKISVYPNPTSSKIFINLDGYALTEIRLTDMMGKQVKSISANGSSRKELDLSDLPRGIYMLQLIGQGKIDTRKIIKQ